MTPAPLTPAQAAEAERLYAILRQATDANLRQLAELLASKPDHQLFGTTEFEVRDQVHQIGALALATALTERKKGGIKVPAAAAPPAAWPPSSSAGRPKPS